MPFRFTPIGAILLGLALLSTTGGCRQSTTSSDAPSDSSAKATTQSTDPVLAAEAVDSLESPLHRFEADAPPSPADSAVLRRWADSLRIKGDSLRRRNPDKAGTFYRRALRGYRTLADSTSLSEAARSLGTAHAYQSELDEALDRFREALQISRDVANQQGIARALNNIGIIYNQKSQYKEALAHYQESLQIERDLDNRKGAAQTLHNIGWIHRSQGQYEEALDRFREALRIKRDLDDRRGVANTLSGIGGIHLARGRFTEALSQYREVLQIDRALGNRRGIAASLYNIGLVHRNQGLYEKALEKYRKSLRIDQDLGDRKRVAKVLNNIGHTKEEQGQYKEALARHREALKLQREIGNRSDITGSLSSIGTAHIEAGRLPAATDTLGRAVRLADDLRLNATSPEARRSLLSTQIGAYRALTTAHVRSGRPASALRTVEQARARLLADRLAGTATGDTSFTLPSPTELRRTLGPDEAALLYANAKSKRPLTALVVTRDTTVARELPGSTARAAIGADYRARLKRLRREDGPLAAATSSSASSGQGQTPSLAATIRLYRSVLTREQADASVRADLSRRFHDLLVEPVAGFIAEKRELVAVPTGALGYLPFETLRDPGGQYLIENKRVRYAQSLTVRRQLQQRDHPQRERPLLALGGASYELDPPADGGALVAEARRGTTDVATEEHATTLFRNASRRMEQGKSPRPTYRQLGYGQWPQLPGTKLEVQKLKRAAGGGARLLTGPAASEEQVRRMSAAGELARYRHVHFATHGVAVPEAPALSALVLSQKDASNRRAARDGYLTMDEIAELNLQADVAVLSACQTGLGTIVAGEGVVSLSHAFLRAGANATLVSQWRVPDWSTQQFMAAVYRRADEEGTSFAEATAEVKRAFIDGEYGEQNTDPLRWAPFVYYGRE